MKLPELNILTVIDPDTFFLHRYDAICCFLSGKHFGIPGSDGRPHFLPPEKFQFGLFDLALFPLLIELLGQGILETLEALSSFRTLLNNRFHQYSLWLFIPLAAIPIVIEVVVALAWIMLETLKAALTVVSAFSIALLLSITAVPLVWLGREIGKATGLPENPHFSGGFWEKVLTSIEETSKRLKISAQ